MSFPLIAVVGPTGSGKSSLALELAERFSGEIVSCDSLQVYKYFDIGTAKLTTAQQRGIPHHLIDIVEPDQLFTAGDYARLGRKVLENVRLRSRLPIVAGGTGLYLKALLEGLFEGPQRSEVLRKRFQRLAARKGSTHLHHLLRRIDSPSALRISPNDKSKLIRALEVFFLTTKPLSLHLHGGRDPLKGYTIFKIGLNPARSLLYQAIDRRVEEMFNVGLVKEVEALQAKGYPFQLKPFQSLGYSQTVAYLQRKKSLEQAIAETQQETRHYVKRQLTWFRKEKEIQWFYGFGSDATVQATVFRQISEFIRDTPVRVEGTQSCLHLEKALTEEDCP